MPTPVSAAPACYPATHSLHALDALFDLDRPIGALRAIEALTDLYQAGGEPHLPGLRRPDLASLLALVTDDLEHRRTTALQAAQASHDHTKAHYQPANLGDAA